MKQFLTFLLCNTTFLFGYSQSQINGPDTVCAYQSSSYTVQNSNATSYTYIVSNGSLVYSNNDSARFSWGSPNNGVIKVLLDSNGHSLGTIQKSVFISQLPSSKVLALNNKQCVKINDRPQQELKDNLRSQGCFSACQKGVFKYFPKNYDPTNSYAWEVDSADSWTISNDTLIINRWGNRTIEFIKLKVSSASGCSDSSRYCVYISENPEAKIFHSPDTSSGIVSLCKNGSLALSNLSTGAFKWSWQIIDLMTDSVKSVSTEEDYNHTFHTPGLYRVQLIAWNHCYCTDTAVVNVEVNSEEAPQIECTGALCENGTMIYKSVVQCPNTSDYNWKVSGNGVITNNWGDSIAVTWSSGPKGIISLALSNGCINCADTTSIVIPIIPSSIPIYGPSIVCANEQSTFWTDCWPGGQYRWIDSANVLTTGNDIGLGTMPQPNYWKEIYINWKDTVGLQNLEIFYKNKMLDCNGYGNKAVQVKNKFDFDLPDKICQDKSFPITVQGSGSMAFDFYFQGPVNLGAYSTGLGGTYLHTFNHAPGEYKVIGVAQSNDYCIDTVEKFIEVVPLPSAPDSIFGPDTICPSTGYEYSANAIDGHTVKWTINNGSPSSTSGSRIAIKWGASGPFEVGAFLVSTSDPFCSGDTIWREVYPKNNQNLSISGLSSVCPSTESSYTVNADPDIFQWSVTGGSIVHGQNSDSIVILWDNNPGSHTISLMMTGCVTYPSLNLPVTIITPPSLQLSPSDPEYCLNENINFTASFSSGTATGNYLWFENGSLSQNSTSNTFSTSYSSVGTKAITIHCENSVCQDTISKTYSFNVVSPPAARIGLKSGSLDDCDSAGYFNAVLFATQEAPGNYTNSWGSSTLTVNSPGAYSCTITDPISGCISTSNTIIVDSCDGSGLPGCQPIDTTYKFNTTIRDTCDSIIASGTPTALTYFNYDSIVVPGSIHIPVAGFYSISLYPSVCYPKKDTIIEVPFVTNFEYSFECTGTGDTLKTQFNDRSTYTDSVPSAWSWNINGGAWTSSLQNPSFALPPDSCFTVNLSAGGCSKTKTVCTPALPNADFEIITKTPICEGFPIAFADSSSGFIVSYLWDFDG